MSSFSAGRRTGRADDQPAFDSADRPRETADPYPGVSFLVVVPHLERLSPDCPRRPEILRSVYPPRNPAVREEDRVRYSYRDAVDVLEIFTGRWRDAGLMPPPALEPYAVEDVSARPPGRARGRRRPVRFTLFEVAAWGLLYDLIVDPSGTDAVGVRSRTAA